MKYKIFILIFILGSCTVNSTRFENRTTFSSKGFAYIYNEEDYQKKTINGKLDNSQLQIAHKDLKINTLIKIINPTTKVNIINKQNRTKLTRGRKVKVSGYKKAIITLKKGQSIDLTTGI